MKYSRELRRRAIFNAVAVAVLLSGALLVVLIFNDGARFIVAAQLALVAAMFGSLAIYWWREAVKWEASHARFYEMLETLAGEFDE